MQPERLHARHQGPSGCQLRARLIREPTIDRILEEVGFTHLPRHTCAKLWGDSLAPIEARGSIRQAPSHSEQFQHGYAAGVLCLLPPLRHFGIDRAIDGVGFPRSTTLPPLPSKLAFVALWCICHGLVLANGLSLLPNAAWMSPYSDHVSRPLNQALPGSLAQM